MIKLFLISLLILSSSSCTSRTEEDKSAQYWKDRYEKLRRFVESKGLGEDADRAVNAPQAKFEFYVGVKSYKFNGRIMEISKISEKASVISPKTQRVNIVVAEDAPHQKLLILLDGLNREGVENFNLISERNLK